MIPDTPSSAASGMGLVEELRAWLREPDYAERFRLLAWVNKRPVAKFYQIFDALTAKDRELAEARAALEEIARQKLTRELRAEFGRDYETDWEGGYDGCIRRARTVLSREKETGA